MSDQRLTSQHTKLAIIGAIRTALLAQGNATKIELSHKLNISFPTISKFLALMESTGEVVSVGLDSSSGGRRAKRYTYNPNYMLGLAIILEKSETNYKVFNCLGNVIDQGSTDSILLKELSHLITFIKSKKDLYPTIYTVSIGVPGAVENGKVFYIQGYENYQNVDLKQLVEEQLSIATVIENDMNAAVIGYMAQRKMSEDVSLFYLYLGQNGPGAGIVVNGHIVRGKTFFSGEVQFIPQYNDRNFLEALTSEDDESTNNKHLDKRVDAISRLVGSVTSILNPHYFIVCEEEIDTTMLQQITERSSTYVPKEHLPLLAASSLKDDYLSGLQSLGLSVLMSQQIED
ncbi:ROK family protein [Paenibacillus endoradicis]|uniref:ROK family protein n=1 Tax=Paenibacillus endoradicis TaxID=2972487 RepID=UPI0021598A9A|nr:ROK family protein [Paenibacillus endoradicis]MCR8658726.1 ROK family protein [Paenibacillus endoradicis]